MATIDVPTPLAAVGTLKEVVAWFFSQLGSFWSWVLGIIGAVIVLALFFRLFRQK